MQNLFYITGLSGVGKSTFINKILNDPNCPKNLEIVNMGNFMFQWLLEKNLINKDFDRNEIKNILTEETLLEIINDIIKTFEPTKIYLFDNHLIKFKGKNENYLEVNLQIQEKYSPAAYVILTLYPKKLYQRILEDGKKRKIIDAKTLNFRQNLLISTAKTLAKELGSDFLKLNNSKEKTEKMLN